MHQYKNFLQTTPNICSSTRKLYFGALVDALVGPLVGALLGA